MNKDFIETMNEELRSKGLPEVKPGSQTQLKTCVNCGRATTVLYKLGRCRTCITTGYKNRFLPLNRIKFF
ncbi:DUF2797 domain-containing protein [Leptospira noguchii]|uniref:DUF2797 domain-containing protein n=1 Tax=Leptospira noguchii TaxID=28182 RepID=A0A9Q8RHN4_9LEPT|nr:DUF2797 domain-containing protein [Leptospira noguchii]TQE69566.1 DUF2797 domain-containing protein [Leptospira noguchii]TQE71264.1 DUF2797 domain-containing protein [Leptospira noguchii]UOG51112.1 DUF2797 domain-containing protein [Leptospira noguchii]UOG54618.1 DUF2797 domain-containing protein [Leptospira noguchii]UOG58653.1 DUF2797 domain-containing protein [Leptospira noguchii]